MKNNRDLKLSRIFRRLTVVVRNLKKSDKSMKDNVPQEKLAKATIIVLVIQTIFIFLYVLITYLTLGELKEHTIKLEEQVETSRLMNIKERRPYIYIEAQQEKLISVSKIKGNNLLLKGAKFRLEFINEGRTPAYPFFYCTGMLPYSSKEFNLRDSIYAHPNEMVNFELGESTYGIKISNFFIDNPEFTNSIMPNHSFTKFNTAPEFLASPDSTYSLHIYMAYRDEFNKFYDIYCTYSFWVINSKIHRIFPIINTYELSNEEVRILSEIKK